MSFINGLNIAWVNFGRDIGYLPESSTEFHPNWGKFTEIMDLTLASGGKVLRFWYHTNGSTNPIFGKDKKVVKNPIFFHEDLIRLLDLAASKKLQIQICLWSFDMLKNQWRVDIEANKKLLTEESHFQAYLENALLPLIEAVGDHQGLYAWEIFNEPEGMTLRYGGHWEGFKGRVSMGTIQKFINKTAAAIRKTVPNTKITNGALGFLTSIDDDKNGYLNYYSDEALFNEGNQISGYLDFYNIHYYQWAKINGSPFHNRYDHYNMDKEVIIAEYFPDNIFGIAPENLVSTLKRNGWHGSMVWSWTDRPWETIHSVLRGINNDILL